jgi:hypothetical protein
MRALAGNGGAATPVLMVEQIHANCSRTLDGLHAALTNDSLTADPGDLAQIKDLAEDIAVLDKEMDDGRCRRRCRRDCGGDRPRAEVRATDLERVGRNAS